MKIKEIENKNLKVKKIKMSCDCHLDTSLKCLNYYNFFMTIIGPPGSGKTTVLLNMLNDKNIFKKKFDRIYLWSPSLHTIPKNKLNISESRIYNNFDLDEINEILNIEKQTQEEDEKILFIFDDMISEFKKNMKPVLKMIYNRRHHNLSVILISQVFNKIPKEIRKVNQIVMFFNNKNKEEIKSLYDDYITMSYSEWTDLLKYCFKTDHDFIIIDNKYNTFYHNFNMLNIEE